MNYDAVQRDLYFHHFAVVDHGRCSSAKGCKFHIDSANSAPKSLIDTLDDAIENAGSMQDKSLTALLQKIHKSLASQEGDRADEKEILATWGTPRI